jgi:formyltetrahydrofolate deformylase
VETDFRVRSAPPRTPGAAREADDRHAEAGRLLITRPDRPGIAAAVSGFPFSGGANSTGPGRYSTDPLCGAFFLPIEFHLTGLAKCFCDLAASPGEIAGGFSVRRQMTRAGTGLAKGGAR